MKALILILLFLLIIGCAAIKPNTMTDEEINQLVTTDCQHAAITTAIMTVWFGGVTAIPVYFIVSHECSKNKELAIKELEIRKFPKNTGNGL